MCVCRVAINQNVFAEGLYLASASIARATGNLVPAITFIMATALGLEHVNVSSLRSVAKIVGTMGVVGSGIAFFVQAWCIARRGPVFFAMFIPLCTVIVTILGAIFLHKEVYTGSMAGAIGVVVGLYIVLWGKAKDIAPIANEAKLLPPSKINLEEPLLRNNLPADDIKEANGRNCV
ncbi:hypothetical protein CDL15_Pgr012587 [Punica granatum]|uniref:WAT1-related protein n=1 Tax=Punica granatum TaxID=22663 RepID=A0A218XYQ0_PUNGR|nr:hypothetical protein CDL15_Pgr012587 [Punica granatum]